MDMMNSIAAQAMSMQSERIAQQYSVSLQKKVMETQELAAQELLEMLPEQPPLGRYIDVRA